MKKHENNSKEMSQLARKIKVLDNPERISALPPEKLLEMIPIKKTDNILDFGAGTGYLTLPTAKMVEGTVYALDIDPEMLKIIKSKAENENINNIRLIEDGFSDADLSPNSIDIVLSSLILHEVRPLATVLKEIINVLNDGGYLLCVEFEKVDNPKGGAAPHLRVPSSTMEKELIKVGFTIEHKLFTQDSLYIFIAKK